MINPLTDPLLQALNRLADNGDVEGACRIAGLACAQVRRTDSETTSRFNTFLHRMVRRLPSAASSEQVAHK